VNGYAGNNSRQITKNVTFLVGSPDTNFDYGHLKMGGLAWLKEKDISVLVNLHFKQNIQSVMMEGRVNNKYISHFPLPNSTSCYARPGRRRAMGVRLVARLMLAQ
jgi:hypothetical protein